MSECWLLVYRSQARKYHHAPQRCICGQPLWDRVIQYMRQQTGRWWCYQAVSGRILFLHDYSTYILISVVNFIVSPGLQSEPSDRATLRSIW